MKKRVLLVLFVGLLSVSGLSDMCYAASASANTEAAPVKPRAKKHVKKTIARRGAAKKHVAVRKSPVSMESVQASFPGGDAAIAEYMKKNMVYPAGPRQEGQVLVSVLLDGTGAIRLATVVNGISHNYDREALRLVINMPNWNPAKDKGQPVDSNVTIPVTFEK